MSLAHYMAQYDHEHSSGWNKLLHGIGIPMIFAGLILFLFTKWIWGGAFLMTAILLVILSRIAIETIDNARRSKTATQGTTAEPETADDARNVSI